MANLNFNAQTVDPQQSFDPLPAGWYPMQIVESEMKPTKDGGGQYLQIKLQVLEGEYAKRTVFERLNLVNSNPTAQEIAYRTLSAICHATGVIQVEDSNQLHGIPMEVKVSVRPAQDGYDASNDVKGYRAVGNGMTGGTPAPQGQGTMPPQQPPMQQPPQQNGGWQQQAPAQQPAWQPPTEAAQPQQPTQQEQPQAQPAPAQQQQPQAWANTPDANPHPAPTQGQAPSANAQAGVPPWGQAPQQ